MVLLLLPLLIFDIETTGLYPWEGDKVTCICAKTSEGREFKSASEDDAELIKDFNEWLKDLLVSDYVLVTKNGRRFDVPFIESYRLAVIYSITTDVGGEE